MAKAKKNNPAKKTWDPEKLRRFRRITLQVFLLSLVLAGSGIGIHSLRQWIEKRNDFPTEPPLVVLKDPPAWMSLSVADAIAKSARPHSASVFDHRLLEEAVAHLKYNPWVRQVRQVRRAFGNRPGDTLEIDCEYRAPVALVHWQDYYWLVDGEGVKLPEQYTAAEVPKIVYGQNRQTNLRIIEGVKREPPESGRKWIGDDLVAGLDLLKLLYGRNYTDEILKVDVSNFAGRREPHDAHLVLVTRYGTQIRWGRPVNARDFFVEVSTAQKLDYLQRVYNEFKRIDARHAWLDIRYDKVTYPATDPQPPTAFGR